MQEMMMSEHVKKQIDKHYIGGQINYVDLVTHLKNGVIDRGVKLNAEVKASGFDVGNNDEFPALFYYSDNSVLIVTGYNVHAAKILP